MQRIFLFLSIVFCSFVPQAHSQKTINTAHLDKLFRVFFIGNAKVAGIQIYAEYPDYKWVGDDDEGDMCIDDAARALVFYCRQYASNPSAAVEEKIRLLTKFTVSMQAENGYFYNFIYGNGQINTTHQNSLPIASFWSWRAFWGLSEVLHIDSPSLVQEKEMARESIRKLLPLLANICPSPHALEMSNGIAFPACLSMVGPDQAAILITALCQYAVKSERNEKVLTLIRSLSDALLHCQQGNETTFPYYAFLSWKHYWHAWGNSQAYALLLASKVTGDVKYRESALKEIDHFYPYLIKYGQIQSFSLMGLPDGSLAPEEIKEFPQISYGLRPMIFAAMEAYSITKKQHYMDLALLLGGWYFGKNTMGKAMYDPKTGRTYDGIQSRTALNRNSGAESTIECLLALQKIAGTSEGKQGIKKLAKSGTTK
jgi:hypothetical protein